MTWETLILHSILSVRQGYWRNGTPNTHLHPNKNMFIIAFTFFYFHIIRNFIFNCPIRLWIINYASMFYKSRLIWTFSFAVSQNMEKRFWKRIHVWRNIYVIWKKSSEMYPKEMVERWILSHAPRFYIYFNIQISFEP
jgi:hypothetical protein